MYKDLSAQNPPIDVNKNKPQDVLPPILDPNQLIIEQAKQKQAQLLKDLEAAEIEKQKKLVTQPQPVIKLNEQPKQDDAKQNMIKILSKLERIVHIDLKGAPPKPEYFKEFLPMIKKFGATGIILEYEDMFPYTGKLEVVRHGNAYSKEDVKSILKLAKDNNLTVMPLVQTYGHLEWLLKHKNFAHLREDPQFPQVISPCIPESYELILGNLLFSFSFSNLHFIIHIFIDMIDQVIELHPDVPYFHIGCDEVYYKLTNPKCYEKSWLHRDDFVSTFMRYVKIEF